MTRPVFNTDKALKAYVVTHYPTVALRVDVGWNAYFITAPGQPVQEVDREYDAESKGLAREEAAAIAETLSAPATTGTPRHDAIRQVDAALAAYEAGRKGGDVPWRYLTSARRNELIDAVADHTENATNAPQ